MGGYLTDAGEVNFLSFSILLKFYSINTLFVDYRSVFLSFDLQVRVLNFKHLPLLVNDGNFSCIGMLCMTTMYMRLYETDLSSLFLH